MGQRRPVGRPYFEIQIHSSDIRRGVRYLFVARHHIRWWWLAASLVALFVVGNLALAPSVVSDLLARRAYRGEVVERATLGGRLRELEDRSAEVAASTQALRIELQQVYLAYGLGSGEAEGQG